MTWIKQKIRPLTIILILWVIVGAIYNVFQGSIESWIATNQMSDSKFTYSLSQLISNGFISQSITIVFGILALWILIKKEKQ